MKIQVPIIVKDPEVTDFKEVPPTERVTIEEEFFLDGPISSRVAVVDFDEDSGALLAGTPFRAPAKTTGFGHYHLGEENNLHARDFIRVSVFGTVYKTLDMFEEPDALGRRIRWAFDGPQLLIVPRAGDWQNAFYQRASRSLQFFFFKAAHGAGPVVYTSQSQDIIAHETTHAILDGIAPDLYDATLPEALALHEAVSDLASVLTAFRSRQLAQRVLAQTPWLHRAVECVQRPGGAVRHGPGPGASLSAGSAQHDRAPGGGSHRTAQPEPGPLGRPLSDRRQAAQQPPARVRAPRRAE